ncbi:MAG: hypothetical protein ACXVMS_16045 [Flavisolibacter sp.]
MFTYPQFHIKDTDRFVPFEFPQLEASLQQVVSKLGMEHQGPRAEMILSFVKDHRMNSQQVKDHPELANLISSKSLPLQVMENLFEAGRKNPLFEKDLEDYIKAYFNEASIGSAIGQPVK